MKNHKDRPSRPHSSEAHITKSDRGWSIHTVQHWSDFPEAHTSSGAPTLKWAVLEAADVQPDTYVTVITVKGEKLSQAEAEKHLRKAASGSLAWKLPALIENLDFGR